MSAGLPNERSLALCPYCLGLFGIEHIEAEVAGLPLVNVEHAPPKQANRLGA